MLEQIQHLRSQDLSWAKIAHAMGLDARTLSDAVNNRGAYAPKSTPQPKEVDHAREVS